jgi:hypothetical protein
MKLYVCWGTFQTPRPGGHPCHNAYEALKQAGWDPEVQRTRKPVRDLTGENWVPVLVTDEDEVIKGSKTIVDWASANPAAGAEATG